MSIKEIYIKLLDEGVEVYRPTKGEEIGQNIFKVLPTDDYDPDDETWEFLPNSKVKCIIEERDGRSILIAKEETE